METRHSNGCLSLYEMGDTSTFLAKRRRTPSNACFPFIIVASASWILNKLRHDRKQSVSFLPSTELGPCLSDVGASHVSKSEMITFGLISDLCLLFEFLK
jgi:hypothetical protein